MCLINTIFVFNEIFILPWPWKQSDLSYNRRSKVYKFKFNWLWFYVYFKLFEIIARQNGQNQS